MASVDVCYLRDAAEVYGGGLCYATPESAGMDLRACFEEEEIINIDEVNAEIADLKTRIAEVEKQMAKYLEELGL